MPFKWRLDEKSQLPIATVETIGQGRWVMCCPLCGYAHDLRSNLPGTGIYEPQCLAVDFAARSGPTHWKQLRADWLRQYPDAARFTSVTLRPAEAVETPRRMARKQAA